MLDVNDRALRNLVIGLGTTEDGVPRQSGFDITAASEVMTVLALSTSLADMRSRLAGSWSARRPMDSRWPRRTCHAAGAMMVIMREAIKPNLLQTLAGTPVLVHAGPCGNIAHGNSSVIADLIGIHSGDYLVTEAGFGADMGAERFFNPRCARISPRAARESPNLPPWSPRPPWMLPVRETRASVGTGFIYPVCSDIRAMSGLSASPAATRIDIESRGEIVGLS